MITSGLGMIVAAMATLSRNLARKLRALRGEQTQRAFARKLGISHATLNLIEQVKENVTIKTLQKICDGLKCPAGSLLDAPPPEGASEFKGSEGLRARVPCSRR